MLARESSGITSSFALRVNTESARETFFTGRAFISEGQRLFMETDLNVACASVIISNG